MRRYYVYTLWLASLALFTLFQEAPEFQEIVDTESRSARGNAIEGVSRNHVRHITHYGFKLAVGCVVKDPIVTPGVPPRHQLVLRTAEWMERMGDPEPTYAGTGTTCS